MSLSSTILGYPRVGRKRELKKAVEAYWAGRSDAAGLKEAEAELRKANLARLVELGLDRDGSALPENSSLYDQVLDITFLLGAVPERFRGLGGLDQYFALARGNAEVFPLEMTKWFDTNYHYLVPEIGPDTPISLQKHRSRGPLYRSQVLELPNPPRDRRPRHLPGTVKGRDRRI